MTVLTIWKFPFDILENFTLKMPAGATVLTAQVQNGRPVLWALVDPANPVDVRHFRVYGTGNMHVTGRYIATFQKGIYAWHLFEIEGEEI